MSDKLLDYDEALERMGGDEEFLNELLQELVIQISDSYTGLKQAVETKNYEDLKSLSHSLKGASANLNVTRLASHFLKLESMGNEQTIDGADQILERVAKDKEELNIFLSQN